VTQAPLPDRISRSDIVALASLVLAGIGIPLGLAAAAGAIGIPSNDDWVYMRAATTLFDTGRVDMTGHTAAFVGQLALVQPLLWLSGGGLWALTAFGLVMAAIAIAATYLLARRFLGMGSAVMVVLLVVAFPGFVRESASFMTDVPAYALGVLCLLLGTRWLQGDGGRATLVASLVAGLLGASIREFAIAAPIAILVAAWARNRASERIWLAGLSIVLAAGLMGILAVTTSMPGTGGARSPDLVRLLDLGPAFATLAAVLLPATGLYVGQRRANFSPKQIIFGAGFACLALIPPDGPFLGNLWTPDGLGGNALLGGYREPVIGELGWGLSGRLALFAAILAAIVALSWGQRNLGGISSSTIRALATRTARRPEAPLILFLAAYAVELVLFASLGHLFDRYLYPLVPAAAILLLRGPARPFPSRSHAFSHGAFVWLAVSAFAIAANSFAYDAARQREGEAAVAMGYDAKTVDAGYEWIGTHRSGAENLEVDPRAMNRWIAMWPSFRPCAVLSNNPVNNASYELIRVNRSAYSQYLFFGPAEPLYLYGAPLTGCPTPPQAVNAP
jgi:4-amino-4-deoxy-L-arabinose transferase-like glycosyltransferase